MKASTLFSYILSNPWIVYESTCDQQGFVFKTLEVFSADERSSHYPRALFNKYICIRVGMMTVTEYTMLHPAILLRR